MSIGETRSKWLQKNKRKVNDRNRKWMQEYRKTNYYITKVKPNRKYKKAPVRQEEADYGEYLKKAGVVVKKVRMKERINLNWEDDE